MREKTLFHVFHPDYLGDDPWTCRAIDHCDAAEKYGEYSDSDGDYPLAGGRTHLVTVRCEKGIEKKFSLSASRSIDYYAEEIT